jgi:hypothetical protein
MEGSCFSLYETTRRNFLEYYTNATFSCYGSDSIVNTAAISFVLETRSGTNLTLAVCHGSQCTTNYYSDGVRVDSSGYGSYDLTLTNMRSYISGILRCKESLISGLHHETFCEIHAGKQALLSGPAITAHGSLDLKQVIQIQSTS